MPLRPPIAWVCPSCRSLSARRATFAPRTIGLQNNDRIQRRYRGNIAAAGEQAHPLDGFYADILARPTSKIYSSDPARQPGHPSPPTGDEKLFSDREKTEQKARIVFGSRLAGPVERREDKTRKSKLIAGVLVPPRPSEPDNCCMSGCVNCVWDVYRDDLEEWAAKSAEARAALQAMRSRGEATGSMAAAPGTPHHIATSMDDDGGGSETNWTPEVPAPEGDLFADIPVGIREFMKTEKMLKQKHMSEATASH